ncbi:MAG: hypothetical protein H6R14_2371 [Proteobacteria bacterium]|nr:hypothetical protein [Pseudomonadota bacterium]
MKKYLAVVALVACSGGALAQSSSFEGVTLMLGASISTNQSKLSNNYNYTNLFAAAADAAGIGTYSFSKDSSVELTPSAQASYTKALSNVFHLGVVAGFDLVESDHTLQSGVINFPNPNNRADFPNAYSVSTKIESKSHWFIGLEPGYAFSKDLLGHLKLSYHEMRANIKTATSISRANLNADLVVTDPESISTFRGYGIGFGATYLITPSYFVKADAEWVRYQTKNSAASGLRSVNDELTLLQTQSIKPASFNLGIQVGYKF